MEANQRFQAIEETMEENRGRMSSLDSTIHMLKDRLLATNQTMDDRFNVMFNMWGLKPDSQPEGIHPTQPRQVWEDHLSPVGRNRRLPTRKFRLSKGKRRIRTLKLFSLLKLVVKVGIS